MKMINLFSGFGMIVSSTLFILCYASNFILLNLHEPNSHKLKLVSWFVCCFVNDIGKQRLIT